MCLIQGTVLGLFQKSINMDDFWLKLFLQKPVMNDSSL